MEAGEGGTSSEGSTETYTLPYVKWVARGKLLGAQPSALGQLRGVGWRFKEGGDMCILMADSW